MTKGEKNPAKSRLRHRILFFLSVLALVFVIGSTLSLYRVSEVSRSLDTVNRVIIPLSRVVSQTRADAQILKREIEHGLGKKHWNDPHWRPREIPQWITQLIRSEIKEIEKLLEGDAIQNKRSNLSSVEWNQWLLDIQTHFDLIQAEGKKIYQYLQYENSQEGREKAAALYPKWKESLEAWMRQLKWGVQEVESSIRRTFSVADERVSNLRASLELILGVMVVFSLFLIWFGDRTLRPLGELTRLARQIKDRGLKKEDKQKLPDLVVSRSDEVSELAQEFHRMATVLLEREKTVESQKEKLQEQNEQLRRMGALNQDILNSIDSVLLVVDLDGIITKCNPGAEKWLGKSSEQLVGQSIMGIRLLYPFLKQLIGVETWQDRIRKLTTPLRMNQREVEGKTWGGQLIPLRSDSDETHQGAILMLDDLTDEIKMQERLQMAENLASVGRLSAQVAHEVRNPLHSIGLEAELALDALNEGALPQLKHNIQSITSGVDRLEKITDNYLKLSRLSSGKKRVIDLREILESVLAFYSPVCEQQGVRVDWKSEQSADYRLYADPDLLEQVLGNLIRNALQALEETEGARIEWALGNTESGKIWLTIRDNGPGIPPEVKEKLFTPFLTSKAQGTGLGLSFSKMVVEDHDGMIRLKEDLDSTRGTCFELIFPMADPEFELGRADDFSRRDIENFIGG